MTNPTDRTNNQTLLAYAYLKAFFGIAYRQADCAETLDVLTEISAWLVKYAAILEPPAADDGKKRNKSPPERDSVFHTANAQRYSHAGNNPILLKDPDGRVNIKFDTGKGDMLAMTRGLSVIIVPLGGGLTQSQKQGRQAIGVYNAATGFSLPQNGLDVASSLSGLLGDLLGGLLSVASLAQASMPPEVTATNYTSSQAEFSEMARIEQSFASDLSKALFEKGHLSEANSDQGSTQIKNITVEAPLDYQDILDTANSVKNSKPEYKDIQIIEN